eukprot:GILJ01008977.1.p1 GENE.GILJ01008977.1~~GILJ01008977.1.p1  ORF type:complete len:455 (-),score=70.29 GILJ01008977.1:109-1473(-)
MKLSASELLHLLRVVPSLDARCTKLQTAFEQKPLKERREIARQVFAAGPILPRSLLANFAQLCVNSDDQWLRVYGHQLAPFVQSTVSRPPASQGLVERLSELVRSRTVTLKEQLWHIPPQGRDETLAVADIALKEKEDDERPNVEERETKRPRVDSGMAYEVDDILIPDSCSPVQSPSHASGEPPSVSLPSSIDNELIQEVERFKALLSANEPVEIDSIAPFTHIFIAVSDVDWLYNQLNLQPLTDEPLLTVTRSVLSKGPSLRHAQAFLHRVVLPKVLELNRAASRFMVALLQEASSSHPQALIHALLIPLFALKSNQLEPHHTDIITKLVKENLEPQLFDDLLHRFLTELPLVPQEKRQWSEPVLGILQHITTSKFNMSVGVMNQLVGELSHQVNFLGTSAKFSTLILNLITKQTKAIASVAAVEQLTDILMRAKNFMSKNALTALKKITVT